jgi:hypothetical protein
MVMAYTVYCIQDDRQEWVRSLQDRLGEAAADIGDPADSVQVRDGFPAAAGTSTDAPAIVVYLGSPAAAASEECRQQVGAALAAGLSVLPCVDKLKNFAVHTPEGPLRRLNGVEWGTSDAPPSIIHFIRETLGLEERQRLVFLSHRRSDALALTEQLHDRLVKNRFWPFVDRFDIVPAEDVQKRIYAALEETAFVVLVESPDATLSEWVLEEVHFALRESLGMLIVTFPGTPPLAGTEGLPRFYLEQSMLTRQAAGNQESNPADGTGADDGQAGGSSALGGQRVLTRDALEKVVQQIEAVHSKALVRRRRRLVGHTRIAVQRAGLVPIEQPGGVLLVVEPGPDGIVTDQAPLHSLVGFSPRPPQPKDLYAVDSARARLGGPQTKAVLVHATAQVPQDASALLAWCRADRAITVLADHLVGAYWTDRLDRREP